MQCPSRNIAGFTIQDVAKGFPKKNVFIWPGYLQTAYSGDADLIDKDHQESRKAGKQESRTSRSN